MIHGYLHVRTPPFFKDLFLPLQLIDLETIEPMVTGDLLLKLRSCDGIDGWNPHQHGIFWRRWILYY